MAVFHKNPAPNTKPRCEAETQNGRCKFRGASYIEVGGVSVFVCRKHAAVSEKGAK